MALLALGIIDELQKSKRIPPISELQHNSTEYLHVIIESLRLAFSDAMYHVADPLHSPPPKHLLSKSYLAERRQSNYLIHINQSPGFIVENQLLLVIRFISVLQINGEMQLRLLIRILGDLELVQSLKVVDLLCKIEVEDSV